MQIKSEIEVDAVDLRQALSIYLGSKLDSHITVTVTDILAEGVAIKTAVVVKATLKKELVGSYMDR